MIPLIKKAKAHGILLQARHQLSWVCALQLFLVVERVLGEINGSPGVQKKSERGRERGRQKLCPAVSLGNVTLLYTSLSIQLKWTNHIDCL